MISLVNVRISRDLSFIFHIMTNPREASLFLRQIRINSFEEFEEWFRGELRRYYDRFYMIQDEQQNNIGFIFSYDYKPVDRHAHFSVYICPEYRKLGAGVEASIVFASMLFTEQNLRKLYSHVYEYNTESMLCHRQAGFAEEGCLREDRYYGGRYWDTYIFSIARESFLTKFEKLL